MNKPNRIPSAFGKTPGGKSFIAFVTGGDPTIAQTEEFILELIRSGADLVEIGIPFSDPVAEGKVIQESNIRALKAGATVEKIFTMVESLRKKIRAQNLSDVPLVFLSYLNPVFRYGLGSGSARNAKSGYAAFFDRCVSAGVDGIIIPDLPFEEQEEVRGEAASRGVDLISLVAPTSRERIRKIAKNARGFLYIVSSLGVTGIRSSIETDLPAIIDEARTGNPALPCAVGFGINTPAQAASIAAVADGVIVGSAIVKIIEEHPHDAAALSSYAREIKAAIS
ncbi:MAG: tryptophan synthase subunit alpha [Treponema sp.]|nr:tryptophan synthase subunit alpha [Treponema sp.]